MRNIGKNSSVGKTLHDPGGNDYYHKHGLSHVQPKEGNRLKTTQRGPAGTYSERWPHPRSPRWKQRQVMVGLSHLCNASIQLWASQFERHGALDTVQRTERKMTQLLESRTQKKQRALVLLNPEVES